MADEAGAAASQRDASTPARSQERRLTQPLPPLQIRVRPWWFPVHELRHPLVFYLEAWQADLIFGLDRDVIPEMEWMSQTLLSVDMVDDGNLVEVKVFGRPRVQNRVKTMILGLAWFYQNRRARAEKMKQLEENLKSNASGSYPAKDALLKARELSPL
ncbi:oocyte-expressed protein homolog [Nycticebus coucang]|uniref:oocyte-expressed protein homolog n=1 Tax=Nycticebus coucang TaxID=9470 RepID=UPI00234D063F|nr:oocyte-expressed protein homolog [Nycticebus coucang]